MRTMEDSAAAVLPNRKSVTSYPLHWKGHILYQELCMRTTERMNYCPTGNHDLGCDRFIRFIVHEGS